MESYVAKHNQESTPSHFITEHYPVKGVTFRPLSMAHEPVEKETPAHLLTSARIQMLVPHQSKHCSRLYLIVAYLGVLPLHSIDVE